MTENLSTLLLHLFTGTIRPLPPEGQPTGMFKSPVDRATVTKLGLVGDHHADKRVHGGPEKAVHLFTQDTYALLSERRPQLAPQLVPGVLGENLSTRGLTEEDVCVGDIFELGSAKLQISQPRSPCWKIDHRLGTSDMVDTLNGLACPGWYFRVLEEGEIAVGDELRLVERVSTWTLKQLLVLLNEHRPDPADLHAIAEAPGLTENWRRKYVGRAKWLQGLPGRF